MDLFNRVDVIIVAEVLLNADSVHLLFKVEVIAKTTINTIPEKWWNFTRFVLMSSLLFLTKSAFISYIAVF